MPVESAADRAAFFSTAEFAVVAQIAPKGRLAYEVSGIFDRSFIDVDGVESNTPLLTVADDDLDRPEIGMRVVVDRESFEVRSVQPSGSGVTRLYLQKGGDCG